MTSVPKCPRTRVLGSNGPRICQGDSLRLERAQAADLAFSVTPSQEIWCRNINQLSIDYAFRPRLGPDSPCADLRGAGNLGFSVNGFFTRFNVTYVSIRTSIAPAFVTRHLRSLRERSSTAAPDFYVGEHPHLRYYVLAPLHFRRTMNPPVSYYAFFK